MPRVAIDDLDDPRIAVYRDLKVSNRTRRLEQFVVEGEKLFDRLLASRFPLVSVLATDRHEPRVALRVPAGVPLYVVPEARINALVGYRFHQGILASAGRRPWPDLEELARGWGRHATVVICPALTNPENLGAIVRIADVFGAQAILVGGPCPDPFSRRVLRVSMGTVLQTPVLASDRLEHDMERLRRDHRFQLVAAVTEPQAEPLGQALRASRLALILGNENEGLAPHWVERCDRRVTIPMRPGAESLNVAVAAGIMLHHFQSEPDGRADRP